ncbi:MAG: outer membrane lipoprotein-sorting protein [Candidatus Marinimicrobia bacterium]|nr:outer membrane lipoprotein-sorting protein [Candidatus Neomarinimicrobiota bacterium]
MPTPRNYIQVLFLIAMGIGPFCYGQRSDHQQAEDLLLEVQGHLQGLDQSARITITQTNRRDSVRVRYLQYYLHYPPPGNSIVKQTLVVMLPPDKAAGQKYWSWQLTDGRQRQWIELAASGKVREIAHLSGVRKKIFDFSDLEITAEDIARHDHTIQRRDTLDGREVTVIKSVMRHTRLGRRPPGYKLLWIDPAARLVLKAEFYNSKGRLLKRIVVEETEVGPNGNELPTLIRVQDLRKKTETVLALTDLRLGLALDSALFYPPVK